MVVFAERIRELSELLPEEGHSRRPDDVALFDKLYLEHSRELEPFTSLYYLDSHIRMYRYFLFNAARAFRNNRISDARVYLSKATDTADKIIHVHSIFTSVKYIE